MTKKCGSSKLTACKPEKNNYCSNSNKIPKISNSDCSLSYFENMISNCLDYANEEKRKGKKVVGVLCEYTPVEIIMAAGGIPVCLCGGSNDTISYAEKILPSNLCPIIKSTFGYSLEKANPFLEMADLVVAETTCDGKKKMYELLLERHPMHVLELPQKPNDPDALKHWVKELKKLKTALEERFSTKITNEKLKKAIQITNNERNLRKDICSLMKDKNPILTGTEILGMKSLIAGIPENAKQYKKILKVVSKKELNTTNRVRVLLTGVPLPHGAERVIEIIENNGGLVVCQENCSGIKPILENINANSDDLIYAIAEKYFHLPCSVMTKNNSRLEELKTLAKEYNAECIIELVWQTCITYDIESHFVKKLSEELGLPYLCIETDYSPSDSARIALRVQALFETINNNTSKPKACCNG